MSQELSMQTVLRNLRDKRSAVFLIVSGLLFLVELRFLPRCFRHVTYDMSYFYLRWYHHILAYGRLHSLEGSYANYSPPTLYLFSAVSVLQHYVRDVYALKLITIPFLLFTGWLAYDICRALGATQTRSVAIGALMLVSPEIWQNSFRWGQYDLLYTCFLLCFYRLILARRPAAAMVLFGTALAFKLQAIFVGPAVLALLLTGEIAVWQVLLVPVMYVLWMVPAALAGRPWKELMLIYGQQYDVMPQLSVDAPNVLFMLQKTIPEQDYGVVTKASILLAFFASLGLVWVYLRRRTPVALLATFTLSLLVVPYLLPKMHERYFFAGDAFAILLIAFRPQMWIAALLLQGTAFLTYRQYFINGGGGILRRDFLWPLLLLTAAILLIGRDLWRERRVGTGSMPDMALDVA